MNKIIATITVLIFSICGMYGKVTFKYPDGSSKVTHDNGETWQGYDSELVTIVYENFTKVSDDGGKTWNHVKTIEDNVKGFIVNEDFIFTDRFGEISYSSYELLDMQGAVLERGDIDNEYIQFQKEYTGVLFIVLTDLNESHIFKLMF